MIRAAQGPPIHDVGGILRYVESTTQFGYESAGLIKAISGKWEEPVALLSIDTYRSLVAHPSSIGSRHAHSTYTSPRMTGGSHSVLAILRTSTNAQIDSTVVKFVVIYMVY